MSSPEVEVRAELAGTVWKLLVARGDTVKADQHLLVMETMKMEIPVMSETDGVVLDVRVAVDQQVREGDVLVVLGRTS